VDGDERMVDQVIKQLRKIVDVTRVDDISDKPSVIREMVLLRVQTRSETRSEIVQLVDIYRGEIVDVAMESMVVQIVGSEERVDSLIDLLTNFGIMEMVRTGRVALVRGGADRRGRRGTAVWKARANGYESEEDSRLSTGGV
jgi:acetolactate synthase-1/3 small subunit